MIGYKKILEVKLFYDKNFLVVVTDCGKNATSVEK